MCVCVTIDDCSNECLSSSEIAKCDFVIFIFFVSLVVYKLKKLNKLIFLK